MMKQVNLKQLMKGVAAGALLMVGASGSALAVTPNCGDVIGPGGTTTFDSDLICPATVDPALTLIGPTNLNLAGYTLKCKGRRLGKCRKGPRGKKCRQLSPRTHADIGILLEGKKAQVHDGYILKCGNYRDFEGAGIVADGDGGHQILRMYVGKSHNHGVRLISDGNFVKRTNSSYNRRRGFDIDSDGNEVAMSSAYSNGLIYNRHDGFHIDGDRNDVKDSDAYLNTDDGFDIHTGDQNKVVKNSSTFNWDTGIEVDNGDDNKINLNTVEYNGDNGVDVQTNATSTQTRSNKAKGNINDDMEDDVDDCITNTWLNNTFITANRICIN